MSENKSETSLIPTQMNIVSTPQPAGIVYPVSEFRYIQAACNAETPLQPGDSRYYDFEKQRGASVYVELGETLLQEPEPHGYHRQILCGHRGSGKTTELLRLYHWADENGYLCVWMDVYDYYGNVDNLSVSDFYLLIAEYLFTTLSEETVIHIDKEVLNNIVGWFAQTISEKKEVDKTSAEVNFAAERKELFLGFKARREASSETLKTVRQSMQSRYAELEDRMTELLKQVNHALSKGGYDKGLLLIFDSLDRYPEQMIENLLLKSQNMRNLKCHTIYTMHISLTYRHQGGAYDYFSPPIILPMIALRHRKHEWGDDVATSDYDEVAVDAMYGALNQRVKVDVLFEEPEDARLLVKMSGGSLRDLFHLIIMARKHSVVSLHEPQTKITHAGVLKGIRFYRMTMTEGLQAEDFTRLVRLSKEKHIEPVVDPMVQRFLATRVALRYCHEAERWTDIHPLVLEAEGFLKAIETYNNESANK